MSDDPIAGLTPRDAHRIRVLLDIVRDLAAIDPLSESKFGIAFCMFCGASENIEDDHMESCVWRRARELQP